MLGRCLLAALFFTGCESVSEVISQRRAAVEERLARVRSLRAAFQAAELTAPTSAPLVLEGPEANAMFIYAEDLAQPGAARPVHFRTLDSVPLLQCGTLLSSGAYFNDAVTRPRPSVVTAYLAACERLQYALIIREVEYSPPQLSLATRSFSRGKYRAQVLAFDLRTGAPQGGYEVSATNEERVSLLDGDDDHQHRLLGNLESTVFNALRDGARTAFPGSLPPR